MLNIRYGCETASRMCASSVSKVLSPYNADSLRQTIVKLAVLLLAQNEAVREFAHAFVTS